MQERSKSEIQEMHQIIIVKNSKVKHIKLLGKVWFDNA